MKRHGVRFAILGACFLSCASLWPHIAAAQQFEEPDFFAGTFNEAHETAKKSHRLHMVFLLSDKPTLRNDAERLWRNRSLNQWVRWHAVLSKVSESEDPELFQWFAEQCAKNRGAGDWWDPYEHLTIVIFRADETERVLPWFPHADTRDDAPTFMRDDSGLLELKPLEVLHQSQFVLDKLQALEPVWFEMHNHKNPPPPAPDRAWFASTADANAPAFAAPAGGEGVISVLERARAEVADGSLADATATYTWLWERMDEGRSWTMPLRRTIVASEMRELALRREGSMARFVSMRDEQASREPWLELSDRFDRYILDEVVHQSEASLAELDYLFNDTDESSLLTRSESSGLALIASGVPWLDLWRVTRDDGVRLSRLRSGLQQKRPSTATDEEWSHVLALRRAVLLSESCRIHTALLRNGNDPEAMKVANALIEGDADGSARMALAAVAWAAGVADSRHSQWVTEAKDLGADDAGLLQALDRQRTPQIAAPAEPTTP